MTHVPLGDARGHKNMETPVKKCSYVLYLLRKGRWIATCKPV